MILLFVILQRAHLKSRPPLDTCSTKRRDIGRKIKRNRQGRYVTGCIYVLCILIYVFVTEGETGREAREEEQGGGHRVLDED